MPRSSSHRLVDVVHEGSLGFTNKSVSSAYFLVCDEDIRHGKQRTQWFALDGAQHTLTRYATSERSKLRGEAIYLLGARIERLPDLKFLVHLHHPYHGLKQLEYVAATPEDKETWMKALINCVNGVASSMSKRMRHRGVLNGQYILVRELGRGASGVVYLYTYHGKPCAVKKVSSKSTKLAQNDVKREIALLKKATNLPHVVSLYDVIQDHDNDCVYMVMEFLGGGPIATYDKAEKRFTTKQHFVEADIKRLMRCTTIGLKYLHGHNLVHRDIKPDNILLTDDMSECKLADLGVAHWFDSVAASVDDTQSMDALRDTKGTYEFMSPEAISGDAYSGFAADIWALGVTLYALVVGKLPFQADSILALFDLIAQVPVVFPASLSPDLRDLLERMLTKDPKARISLEDVLRHPWLSAGATKTFFKHATCRFTQIELDDTDIHGAVSPLQLKFDMMRRASPVEQVALLSAESVQPTFNAPYNPQPIEINSETELPAALQADASLIAHQVHFQWCFDKCIAGWKHSEERNDDLKLHPLLKPFRELDSAAQARNLSSVATSIKCILALGYTITKTKAPHRPTRPVSIPMSLTRITLSGELIVLGDLLAENDHEVWAREYMQKEWTFGSTYDQAAKHHPALVPYPELPESHRETTRLGALNILKSLVGLHYVIEHPHAKYHETIVPTQRRRLSSSKAS
ncbi:hypothetical protein LEN26_019201 [Aphanomyces euteiches]|nr:hypothetical protein LEN26_019201 [Aphanomyces euteiches]KAH9114200.1 hypothetical protein AeMF1_011693 [Aphanomyces euteiches]KAH9196930.1 hypothetical protein AeNC1_001086 [Aphanomyces euteiches]